MHTEYFPVAPGIWMDITRAKKLVAKRAPDTAVRTKTAHKLVKNKEAGVNRKHLKNGKLSKAPVIMMRIAGKLTLIDGWHRSCRAYRDGYEWIAAYVLTDEEAEKCAMDSRERK